MQVGHPLPGTAAEFADIVSGGAAGHQRQIHGDTGAVQGAARRHGHMVDAGDVLQRAVGRSLQPQTHQLIDVLPLPTAQHLDVADSAGAAGQLRFRQEPERPGGVRRQHLVLRGEQHLQHRQEKHGSGAEGLRRVPLRIQQAAGKVVGIGQPALLRRSSAAESVQLRTAQGQHVGAAQTPPLKQGYKALHIALRLQTAGKRLSLGQPVRRRAAGKAAAQGAVHLTYAFFRHRDPSRFQTPRRQRRRMGMVILYAMGRRAVNIFGGNLSRALMLCSYSVHIRTGPPW